LAIPVNGKAYKVYVRLFVIGDKFHMSAESPSDISAAAAGFQPSGTTVPTVTLGISGLLNVSVPPSQNDFTFVVGNVQYQCPAFVASCMSPLILYLRTSDPCVSEFVIETADPRHYFPQLLRCARGEPFLVDSSNGVFLLSVLRKLDNAEMYSFVLRSLEGHLTLTNITSRLANKDFLSFSSDEEISFLASNFHCLPEDVLNQLSPAHLIEMLQSNSLRLKSEDALYDFIASRGDDDVDYYDLLEFVRFDFLTSTGIAKCLDNTIAIYEHLNPAIFKSTAIRLILTPVVKLTNPRAVGPTLIAIPMKSDLFDVILNFLSQRFGGHVHDIGVVIFSQSSYDFGHEAKYLASPGTDKVFISKSGKAQWFCLDFRDRKVRPTHYSLRSHSGDAYLKSWIIEGSEDEKEWTELDRQMNTTSLKGKYREMAFEIANPVMFRYIRLASAGDNHNSNSLLCASGFELFGEILGDDLT
jgi:hypothetical protein